jgi:hypothetical protein
MLLGPESRPTDYANCLHENISCTKNKVDESLQVESRTYIRIKQR